MEEVLLFGIYRVLLENDSHLNWKSPDEWMAFIPRNKRRQRRCSCSCVADEGTVSRITSATKFFRYLLPLDIFHVLHLAAVSHLTTAKCLDLYLPLNQSQNSLTLLQRGCLLGWRECCPCQSGTWSDHRMNANSAGRQGLVSPGWCPGGPGSPGTARWRGTGAASSSQGPCNPPGHLQKGKEEFRAMECHGLQGAKNVFQCTQQRNVHRVRHVSL